MFVRTAIEAVVDAAVREALRLMPDDVGVHVAEHAVHVAARKRVVRTAHDVRRVPSGAP